MRFQTIFPNPFSKNSQKFPNKPPILTSNSHKKATITYIIKHPNPKTPTSKPPDIQNIKYSI